ncbi:GNAT family N-acetyltransferase [Pseudochrobactrum lubricantis]|uniref:GNAT family N-acetyltransferase n=1 Tax=Pseudochrobactrum lubricantis TaxID=558172 RepID=UPI0035E1477C
MSHSPVKQPDIRPVREQDRSMIDGVITAAFDGADEVALVRKLAADGDIMLELVAEIDGQIAGHILFSRLWVEQSGNRLAAVALAPLAVSPEMQRTGLGSALVEAAHKLLLQQGEVLSIVLGDPAYYGRFGYSVADAAQFESPYPAQYLQLKYLTESKPCATIQGKLIYASAFGEN